MSQYQPKWSDHFQSSYETNMLIDLAEKYGLKTTPYNQKRLQYMAQSSVFEKMWMRIKEFFSSKT